MIKKTDSQQRVSVKKGQSTVEYLLVFGVVVLALVIILQQGGFFHKTLNNTIIINVNSMARMSKKIFNNIP